MLENAHSREANLNPPEDDAPLSGDELERRIDEDEKEWLQRVRRAEPELSPLAWDGGRVAGAYLCERRGVVGEIAQVAVRRDWRRRGISRALCMHSLRGLHQCRCRTARLFTSIAPDENEPVDGPYAMYRKFGFKPIARHLRFRKPLN